MDEAESALKTIPLRFVLPGAGCCSLPAVYMIWATVVLALYPHCRWYDGYKTRHKERWWLSYL